MNRERRYWGEYAAEKAAALKMAAKLTAREKGLVVTDTKRRLVNEAMHDQTRQRRFERKCLSLEFPKDDGLPYDYSFGNREVNRMIRALDAPIGSTPGNCGSGTRSTVCGSTRSFSPRSARYAVSE